MSSPIRLVSREYYSEDLLCPRDGRVTTEVERLTFSDGVKTEEKNCPHCGYFEQARWHPDGTVTLLQM